MLRLWGDSSLQSDTSLPFPVRHPTLPHPGGAKERGWLLRSRNGDGETSGKFRLKEGGKMLLFNSASFCQAPG